MSEHEFKLKITNDFSGIKLYKCTKCETILSERTSIDSSIYKTLTGSNVYYYPDGTAGSKLLSCDEIIMLEIMK